MRSLALGLAILFGCTPLPVVKPARVAVKPPPRPPSPPPKPPDDFIRYKKNAQELGKYHDDGNLDDEDVLTALRTAGVVSDRSAPAPKPGSSPEPTTPVSRAIPVPAYPGPYIWPLNAGLVTSEFGARWGKWHQGLDIAADNGVPVLAAADGGVLYAGDQLRTYGNVVILRHDDKTTTIYAHLGSLEVVTGQAVTQGQELARLGSSGRSTGPHLHFEFRDRARPFDPRRRLPKSWF